PLLSTALAIRSASLYFSCPVMSSSPFPLVLLIYPLFEHTLSQHRHRRSRSMGSTGVLGVAVRQPRAGGAHVPNPLFVHLLPEPGDPLGDRQRPAAAALHFLDRLVPPRHRPRRLLLLADDE